jgi:hypothetical protein
MTAFDKAWNVLKALPGQQIVDTMGDMRTVDPIIARLVRDSADPLGLPPQVSLQSGYTGPSRNQGVINTRPDESYETDDNYDSFVDDYGNLQYAHMMSNSGDPSRFGISPQFQTDLSNPFSPYYVRHYERGTPHELLREGLTNFNVTIDRGPDNLGPFRQNYTPVTPEQVVNPRVFPFNTPMSEREPTEKLLTDSAKFNYAIENR